MPNRARSLTAYKSGGIIEIIRQRIRFSKIDQCKDVLIDYYKNNRNLRPSRPRIEPCDTLTSISRALGDAVNYSGFFEYAFKQDKLRYGITRNSYVMILKDFNPYINIGTGKRLFKSEDLGKYDWGNGNLLQRFCRSMGVEPPTIPRGFIGVKNLQVERQRIGFSFTTGNSAFHKTNYQHPRQIYPRNLFLFQKFINQHPEYEFVEFGKESIGLKGVTSRCGLTIEETIPLMATCGHFITLNSGLMHVALALKIPTVAIVNIPSIEKFYLPELIEFPIEDLSWFAPQTHILHQDGGNALVPPFSLKNLEKALHQETYPFDRAEEFATLIFDARFK